MAGQERYMTIFVLLCIAGFIISPVQANTERTVHDPSIRSFSYSGGGAVGANTNTQYVWKSARHTFDVLLQGGDTTENVQLCLHRGDPTADETPAVTCIRKKLPANSRLTVKVPFDDYLGNKSGGQTISATIRAVNDSKNTILDRKSERVVVLRKGGDFDGDGLKNVQEVTTAHTDPLKIDTDGDSLSDGREFNIYHTDPDKKDTDGDGLADNLEVNTYHINPNKADTDGDGLSDANEVNVSHSNPNRKDTDSDGVPDGKEINLYHTNPNVADTDGDGLPDLKEVQSYHTDPGKADTDGDGLSDGKEVNVYQTDPNKLDTDNDRLNDGAEVNTYHTNPNKKDTDGDSLSDGKEVDVYHLNPNKRDTDGDENGDGVEILVGTDPTNANKATVGMRVLGVAVSAVVTMRQFSSGLAGRVLAALIALAVCIIALIGVVWRTSLVSRIRTLSGPVSRWRADDKEADGIANTVKPIENEDLANDERVLRLLDEHGGRVKQSEIVSEYKWSKATVSRTLSAMEENGDIVKIDIGQTNLITRPDDDPDLVQSSSVE